MYAGQWIETLGMSEARYREAVLLPRAEWRVRLEAVQAHDGRRPFEALHRPLPARWVELWLRRG